MLKNDIFLPVIVFYKHISATFALFNKTSNEKIHECMKKSAIFTTIAILIILTAQFFWTWEMYKVHLEKWQITLQQGFEEAIMDEAGIRNASFAYPERPRFYVKSKADMTPEEAASHKGDTLDYKRLKAKNVAGSMAELIGQLQQDALLKRGMLPVLPAIDSLLQERHPEHAGLNRCILLQDGSGNTVNRFGAPPARLLPQPVHPSDSHRDTKSVLSPPLLGKALGRHLPANDLCRPAVRRAGRAGDGLPGVAIPRHPAQGPAAEATGGGGERHRARPENAAGRRGHPRGMAEEGREGQPEAGLPATGGRTAETAEKRHRTHPDRRKGRTEEARAAQGADGPAHAAGTGCGGHPGLPARQAAHAGDGQPASGRTGGGRPGLPAQRLRPAAGKRPEVFGRRRTHHGETRRGR